ncbi:MAG: glycoside hydrolase family 16 protein [Actinomycetes bacterium]
MFRTRIRSSAIALTITALLLVGVSAASGVPAKKNLALPTIPTMIGTGETITVTKGRWNQTVTQTFQWLLDGKPIKKATKVSYLVLVTDLGHQLSVVETAKFKDKKTMFVNSVARKVGNLIVSGTATISFKSEAHTALVVTSPAVPKSTATKTITWYAGGSLIEGENTVELAIDKRFESLNVTARVVYGNAGYSSTALNANSISFNAAGLTQNALIWSDEFNGEVGALPSASDWNDVTGNGRNPNDPKTPVANGWGNLEREYYLPGSSVVQSMVGASDGKGLLITAKHQATNPNPAGPFDCWYSFSSRTGKKYDPPENCEWVSGKITTEDKIGFLYGHLEARIKTTGTAGTWPAFWMLGQDFQKVGWPGCGEIDIHEGNGALPNSNWGTLHGYSYWPGGQKSQDTSMIAGWHVYGLDWKPNYIAFSVDGEIYKTINASDLQSTPWNLDLTKNAWEFNKPQFAILNLAIGGKIIGNNNLPVRTGDINTDTKTMQIDYIRYSSLDGYGTLIRY